MSAEPPRALLDALHAELLVELQQLTSGVEALKTALPAITGDLQAHADGVRAAAAQTLVEFEAMGHALVEVVKERNAEERKQAAAANAETAQTTEKALAQFTKYFWLLCALVGTGVILQSAVLLTLLLRR